VPPPIHFRLDSSHPANQWKYAATPKLLLRCEHENLTSSLRDGNEVLQTWDDPTEALDWMEQHALNLPSHSNARWIGFLSYDLGRIFENLPATAADDLILPLFEFGFCDHPLIHPSPGIPGEGREAVQPKLVRANPTSNFTQDEYCHSVARVIEYIRAGDVFQVNLSQRFTVKSPHPADQIYARLQSQTPARYGALLDFGPYALISNSPELFLKITPDRHITTRPIKGTRPRLPGMDRELETSEKDRAELNMIVDLERNDLGRVCEIGSVHVTQARIIEPHPTVYHGAATIEGRLRPDVSLSALLRATFPGGSVTGAPKIRAMQIIEELEPVRRGPYCGAIGYLAPGGQLEFNIAIRTMTLQEGHIHIPVGGGIVADSDPESEYEETLVKARAMFSAIAPDR
jgi:para-aminobenzoate synthetase component 1